MWKNLCLLIFIISSVSGAKYVNNSGSVTWNDFLTKAKYASSELLQMLEPYFSEHYPFGNVSEKCTKSLIRFTNGLKDWESWAVRMADANGKFPSGFITGTKIDFGSYEECLSLRVDANNETESFKGQVCMMGLQSHLLTYPERPIADGRTYEGAYGTPPDWIAGEIEAMKGFVDLCGLYLAICTPSTCPQEDIYNILKAIAKPVELQVSLDDCHTDEPRKLPSYATIILAFLSCWLGIILLGTAWDVFDRFCENGQTQQQPESVYSKILKAFSLCTNTEKLLDTRNAEGPLGYLFGVRFILCLWVLFGHLFLTEDYWKPYRYNNLNQMVKFKGLDARILDCAPLSVDIFLVISGFLIIYNPSKKTGKPKLKESFLKSFVKKYIRLMSPVIFLILLTFVAPFVYNGPVWNSSMDHEVAKCRNYGWSNLVFLNNIYTSEEMCWAHTWYIAAALQIQIVSFLILALVKRHRKTGIIVGILAVLGCFTHVTITAYQQKIRTFAILVMKSHEEIHRAATLIYSKPFMHFPCHIIGMITGYIAKKNPGPLPMVHLTIGWIFFIITLVYVIYLQWVVFPPGIIPLFFAAMRNTMWSICWAWFVYACTTNQGTILNKFLSWKPFVPLGKLSYCFYIFHPLAMLIRFASLRERIYMGKIPLIIDFLALSVGSSVLSFIVYITVESSFNVLCDIWGNEGPSPSRTASTSATNDSNETLRDISDTENISKKEL